MKRFGVVGAGTMGSGIAQKVAIEGYPVTVVDVNDAALERGRGLMEGIFAESVQRRIMSEDKATAVRQSIEFTSDYGALAGADLVVEAVFEDREVKSQVFATLERVVSPTTVIATNTSSFPVTELAKPLANPERLVGLHYFYHPVKNRLLEVAAGAQSDPAAVEQARRFCALQGKVEILCKDSPGFVVNRFFVPWLNEAVRLLAEGIAPLAVIEATCKQGFRLGLGPFELMNLTGVPIAAHAANGLADYLGDFYRPDALLVEQAAKGTWMIEASEEYSPAVLARMLGVTWAVAGTLVDERTCVPLDVDLGAQVGLRWPAGPFTMLNKVEPKIRDAAVGAFRERYPEYPFPECVGSGKKVSIPAVVSAAGNGVTTIELARPDKSNALNGQVFAELQAAVASASSAPVLVLRGKGKNFAAGADVRFFIQNIEAGSIGDIIEFTAGAQRLLQQIEEFPGKVVAAIDGFALGGGAELMLAADVIAATPRALIGFPETGIGIFPGLGGCWRLARRVGPELAAYLVLTGQMLDGATAASIGLVDCCLPPEQMSPARLAGLAAGGAPELDAKWKALKSFFATNTLEDMLAGELTEEWQLKIQKQLRSKAPLALRQAAGLISEAAGRSITEESAEELRLLPGIFATQDALTGLKSIGKYKPEFTGQ